MPDDDELGAVPTTADARALLLACVLATPADPRRAIRGVGAPWRERASLVPIFSHAWERVRSDEVMHVIEE